MDQAQQHPSASEVARTKQKKRKPSGGDELTGWAEDIDEQLVVLHAAVLEMQDELALSESVYVWRAMKVIRSRIASIHEATAHMRRGAFAREGGAA